MSRAVRESIRAVTENSWIVGGKLLISREAKSPNNIPSGDDDFSYAFRELDEPPTTQRSTAKIPFPLVYDAGDAHAVWKIGDSFLKVVIPSSTTTTREHITLELISEKALDLPVRIPKVLYHGEWGGRYYVIVTLMPGQTLDSAWPQLSEEDRRDCIDQITIFCKTLSTEKAKYIGGVDGNHLPERFLTIKGDEADVKFSRDKLLQTCTDLEMDCSEFLLYHCDLGPGNIMVDIESDVMSVIDIECVGYVPVEWIRTKFRISGGLDLTLYDYEDEAKFAWRVGMQKRLGLSGFPEVAERWMQSRYSKGKDD